MPPSDSVEIQKRVKALEEQKKNLQIQITKANDSKNMLDLKNTAMAGPSYHASSDSKDGGFKYYHLLFIALFGLLFGAYVQIHYMNSTSTKVPLETPLKTPSQKVEIWLN